MENIDPRKLLLKIAGILENLKINYFITGGFAVSVWGKPRTTFDIDIVVELIEPQIKPLSQALKKISELGYIDEDTARDAITKKGEFNFIDPETGLKTDFWVTKGDKRSKIEFERRIPKKVGNKDVYFISPEDLILNKLIWSQKTSSSRHIEDVESIIKLQKNLDKQYLRKWVEQLNISEELNKLWKKT